MINCTLFFAGEEFLQYTYDLNHIFDSNQVCDSNRICNSNQTFDSNVQAFDSKERSVQKRKKTEISFGKRKFSNNIS